MNDSRYGKYIITELRAGMRLPSFRQGEVIGESGPGSNDRKRHVLWVDDDSIAGAFHSEYVWHFPGKEIAAEKTATGIGYLSHIHPFDEVIAFVGTNQDDLFDLGGEVELWLENERFSLTRSFLVYVPAGMRHCPLRVKRAERPIFQYVLGSGPKYEGTESTGAFAEAGRGLSRHFVFDYKKNLVHPEYRGTAPDEPGRHMHIAYLDAEVVPGANFYVEASWFGTAPRPRPEPGKEPPGPKPHAHPFPEIITFFGTNPDDVYDLGGEVELWIDDEQHIITRSCVVYIPGDVIHCPLFLRRVERPIFHFTAGPGQEYI